MRLQDIPIGTRFEYQGQVFVKTGPITAASEAGGQQMIPRYVVLKLLDPLPETPPASSRTLDETKVLAAFDMFYRTCFRITDDFSRAELEAARRRFIAALK
jgi:hypothetical protein